MTDVDIFLATLASHFYSVNQADTEMQILRIHSWLTPSIIFFWIVGCYSHTPSFLETRPLSFESEKINEMTLVKSSPEQAEEWWITFQKNRNVWQIVSLSQRPSPLDLLADDIFIRHLLDALKTIKIHAVAPHGPLESFRLNPPLFAIRIKTEKNALDLQVGSLLHQNQKRYISLDGKIVYIASGTGLELLEMIHSIHFLRKKNWSLFIADDVDEMELTYPSQPQKPKLYAQREGDQWTDQRHQVVPRDFNRILNHITQVQADQLIDNSIQADELRKFIHSSSNLDVKLTNRQGKVSHLEIKKRGAFFYGISSDRPLSIFVFNLKTGHSLIE